MNGAFLHGCTCVNKAPGKGGNMKKVFALVILSICMTAPSFAKVVGHSAKVAGKDTAKAAKGTAKVAKGTAKGTARVLSKLF
jgi:hypothetical protein